MPAEPELDESADPRALVRGDPAAVQATVEHLTELAVGCAATAHGLDAIGVGAWSGAAADAFRARFADARGRWSRAAAAFRSAAQAWERFGNELVAAQEQATVAAARFRAAPVVSAAPVTARAGGGGIGAPGVAQAAGGVVERAAARRLLADARARRDRSAEAAAREIAAAAALAPDPPSGGDRRIAEAADWVQVRGSELAHVGAGFGEGVEDALRLARIANPADPYNLNHPGRFVANASTALAGAVADVVHPLRQVAEFVGSGWGSDPARAYGHLLPTVLLPGVLGRPGVGVPGPGQGAGGAAVGEARSVLDGAADGPVAGRSPAAAGPARPVPLWADPRPTARPFEPAPLQTGPTARPFEPAPQTGPAPASAAASPSRLPSWSRSRPRARPLGPVRSPRRPRPSPLRRRPRPPLQRRTTPGVRRRRASPRPIARRPNGWRGSADVCRRT